MPLEEEFATSSANYPCGGHAAHSGSCGSVARATRFTAVNRRPPDGPSHPCVLTCRAFKRTALRSFRHGHHRRRHRHLPHADHRLRARRQQAAGPGLGADLRGLRAGAAAGSPRRSPTCCSSSTTTTSPRSSSITTRTSRSASASSTRWRTKAAARASCRRSRATRRSRGTSRTGLVADEFDMSFFQDKGARPRLLLAAVAAVAARAGVARRRSCRCRWACCSFRSRPRGAATSSASRCARRSRAIPRTSRSRSSAPAACRTRCTASAPASTTRRGTWSSSTCSRRIPERLTEHHHRRVRRARRHRRLRSHHVAGHARRAVGEGARSCTRPTTCRR